MPPVAPLLRLGHLADGTPALGQAEVLLSGFGVERFGGGALYTGSFHRGRWHGRGALTSKDPRGNPITHDGMWRDGLREGRGVETLSHQSSTCVGAWSKGSKHGAFRCLVNGSWRAEGWDHGVRTRARAVPSDAASSWWVEPGVRFALTSHKHDRWLYRGDVVEEEARQSVAAHGSGFSLWEEEGRWSYYGGWAGGVPHGPAHRLFPDGSYFVGNLSGGTPRRGFFGLPNGSALHTDGSDATYLSDLCGGALVRPGWLLL